jgi:hypothetical protein
MRLESASLPRRRRRRSLLGFVYDHSHHFLALRLDQNYLSFDHCGFEPPGLRHEFGDGRRNRRKADTTWHYGTNCCSKTGRRSIILLGLTDALVNGLLLNSRKIDMRRGTAVEQRCLSKNNSNREMQDGDQHYKSN